MSEYPVTLNPDAVGDPNQTPIVQLPPAIAAALARMACPACEWINHSHKPGCTRGGEAS